MPTEHFAALCPVIIDEDREKARRIGLRGQRFFVESLNQWAQGWPGPDVDSWGDDLTSVTDDGKMVVLIGSELIEVDFSKPSGALLNPNNAYGTVDDAIHYVDALIEAGADEVLFFTQMGTVPQDIQLQTIRALGEHVIPHFRAEGRDGRRRLNGIARTAIPEQLRRFNVLLSRRGGYMDDMALILWLIAVVIAVIGIVQLLQGQILLGIILLIVACLVGPGGYSIFRGRSRRSEGHAA